MKIRVKISLVFIAQFLFAFFILTILVSYFSYTVSRRENTSHLETATEARIENINLYFDSILDRLRIILNGEEARLGMAEYLANGIGLEKLNNSLFLLSQFKSDVRSVGIFDNSGELIVVNNFNNDHEEEVYCKREDVFQKGRDGYNIQLVQKNGKVRICGSGPIIHQNKLEGVGLIELDISEINNIVTDRTGLGETGEVLVAILGEDGEPVFLNERRYQQIDPDSVGEEISQPMKIALSGESGSFFSMYDYSGNKVMAVVRYMPEYGLGIEGKVNETESLAAVRNIIIFFFGLVVFFTILTFVITNAFIRKITKPIENLLEGIKTVEAGNMDFEIVTEASDEFGVLTKAYNRMIQAIKKSRASIDKKVKEQTEEIQKRSLEMHEQQRAILNILEDVDEEKHNVEKEKDKLNKILYSIGDGVFVVDKNLNIILYNQAAARISGYSTIEAKGKNYREILNFVHEKDGSVSSDFIDQAFKTGKIQEMSKDTVLINRNGEKIAVADSAAPLVGRDGKVIGCVVVFRDVTKEREVDRAKTEFVSLASHQLRTPLSAINWYAEMLIAGDAGKLNKEQKEYIQEIYNGNQRMVDLVNALLDVSRIELGTFSVEPVEVDLKNIMEIIISELKNKIDSKKLKFNSRVDKGLKSYSGDPKLLNIIFQNLISNAVKYTPDGGEVKVQIKKGVEHLHIIVADSGIGIPDNQKDKIFTKLFRADNVRESDTEGTGLGLYIVKSIIEQSGGSIAFVSKQNKGTAFTVKLPLSGMKKKEGTKQLGS